MAALILGFECCVSSWKGISNRYLSCFIYFEEEAKNGLKSIRIAQQKPKQKVRKKKKVIFGRVPFFQGSLCIRRCGVGVGVRCGSVCVRSCASKAARVGRRGIWNRVCSFSRSYCVIILRNTGSAIAIMTTPNAMRTMRSVDI